ncbi:hypothetical protein D3C80_1894280 [compost metagenome]
MGRQAELVLDDGSGVRQPFFVTVLGYDDQGIDGLTLEFWVVGEQGVGGLDAQVGGFLISIHARQKGRTDLAENEGFILVELCTLGVVVNPGCRNVTRYTFYANHYGFPIINS